MVGAVGGVGQQKVDGTVDELYPAITAGVSAVMLNVTASGATAPSYLTAYPTGITRPHASNLNYAGETPAPVGC